MRTFLKTAAKIIGILCGVLIILVVTLFLLMPHAPKPPDELNSIAAMEADLEEVVASDHPPGLSLAVVKDGDVVYTNSEEELM